MKVFAVASAVAAVAAAEADPQTFLYNTAPLVHAPVVHTSPLLKTIVPAATKTVTYTKPVAAAAYHVPFATQYVAHQPTVVYSKPEEVKKVEVEEDDEGKKVVAYANTAPIAYGQPLAYPTIYNTHQYVQAQPLHYAAAVPAQKVYHAKSAEGVEHTVINKREAEAEAKPFDYVSVQTGPLSSVKYPTIQKTLSAYNKYPVAYAAQPALVNTPYVNTPYVNTPYVNTPYVNTPYVAQQYATPYGYPTYF